MTPDTRRSHRARRPAPSHSARHGSARRGRRRAAPHRRGRTWTTAAVAVAALTAGGLLLAHPATHRARVSLASATSGATAGTTAPAASPAAAATKVTLAVPAELTLPGHLDLDWPASGQAAVAVEGLGLIGSSGPASTPQPIASVTKTMTAYLVLKDHPLAPGQQGPDITVTAEQAGQLPAEEALQQSLVPVYTGEQFTERQALQALMLASADNMAQILADWDAGTETAFVTRMNATANALGMTHTTFTQPSGYLGTSISTAPDLVTLGEAAMNDPAFAQIVDQSSATIPSGTVTNYNTLLGTDGVNGIKTGSTYWAGGCLLFSATTTVDGHTATLIGAILGQPGTIDTMLPNVFAATRQLINSTDNTLTRTTLLTTAQTIATRTGNGPPQPLHLTHNLVLTDWPGLTFRLQLTGTPNNPALAVQTPDGHTDTTIPLTTTT